MGTNERQNEKRQLDQSNSGLYTAAARGDRYMTVKESRAKRYTAGNITGTVVISPILLLFSCMSWGGGWLRRANPLETSEWEKADDTKNMTKSATATNVVGGWYKQWLGGGTTWLEPFGTGACTMVLPPRPAGRLRFLDSPEHCYGGTLNRTKTLLVKNSEIYRFLCVP